jgi:hypothetical protein
VSTESTTKTVRFTITGGDGRFELHRQLELVGTKVSSSFPFFRIEGNLEGLPGTETDHIQITGAVALHPLNGDDWAINGIYPRESPFSSIASRIPGTFIGQYNTRTRKGYINVTFGE